MSERRYGRAGSGAPRPRLSSRPCLDDELLAIGDDIEDWLTGANNAAWRLEVRVEHGSRNQRPDGTASDLIVAFADLFLRLAALGRNIGKGRVEILCPLRLQVGHLQLDTGDRLLCLGDVGEQRALTPNIVGVRAEQREQPGLALQSLLHQLADCLELLADQIPLDAEPLQLLFVRLDLAFRLCDLLRENT